MESYRKLIKRRIEVLENEIKKYDKEISGISASIETILRERARNFKEQMDRTQRFIDIGKELESVMTEKEMIEQRLDELEVMKAVIKSAVDERKNK